MTGVGQPSARLHVPLPVWMPIVEWAVIVGLVATLVGLAYRRWRRHHRPKIDENTKRWHAWVNWAARQWPWHAQNLGLVMVDDTTRHRKEFWTGKTLPPAVRFPRASFGLTGTGLACRMWTIPGVGLDEVTKKADHLANAWGCVRVDVRQESPGVLLIRGHAKDPLAQPWSIVPDGRPLDAWALHVGLDEDGGQVHLPLANLSGITIAGIPGTGKTSLQRWWLCQLASNSAAQIAVLDGKVGDPDDGDYGPLSARCFATAGDDLDQANQLLTGLYDQMRARSAWLRANRGTAQFWDHGPTPDCPLVLVVVDESHTYVTAATKREKETCESNVWHLTKLAKEGRSRGFVTVFVTQKQTADAIPTAIRDVCQVGISFGVRTMDGAVAALGDEIRQYPEIAPTELVGRQWTGVAVMRLPDRPGYYRVRTPYVSEADAARITDHYATLTQQPRTLHAVDSESAQR